MALFSKIDTCILCGEEKKVKKSLVDGSLCKECYKMIVPSFNDLMELENSLGKLIYDFTKTDLTEIKEIREKELEEKEQELNQLKKIREQEKIEKELNDKINLEKFKKFTVTDSASIYLEVDKVKKQWIIPKYSLLGKETTKVYSFSDIASYQLIKDDKVKITNNSRVSGSSVEIMGIDFHSGKVKGETKVKKIIKRMYIKIILNGIDNPAVFINISDCETTEGSFFYKDDCKKARKILDLLDSISK